MSLLMDALRKAEESKQRNASLNAAQEGAKNQPLADHANAASFAIKSVDTENTHVKLDSAAHNIDIQHYSSVQSASSERALNAQHWGMLFDKSASHNTAWMTASDLEEETKTLLEWDDSLASTLFPQKSSADSSSSVASASPFLHSSDIETAADCTGTAFTDFTEIPTHATKATALNLDLSGLTDDAASLDSDTGTLSATDLTTDAPFLDLSGLMGESGRDDKLSLDLTGLEDVTDAESEAQAAATIDGILLQDDTSTLETALQAEAENLNLDEDSVLQMEQALNDIDPSELDWRLTSDVLEKEAESVAIQQDDDLPVDWSAVSIETIEQTGASTPRDEFSEGMGAAESAEPIEHMPMPDVPILDLELPDYTHLSAHSEEMPVVEVAQPDNALKVPALDLDWSNMNMSAATTSADSIGTNSGLDWGDVLSESNTPVSPEELQRAWGGVNPKAEPAATLNVDAPTPSASASAAESLELEWSDALLPLPKDVVLPKLSSAAAQPEAQKQQAAQDLLKATKRHQRHIAKFNAYSLLGLISIAVLGFVLLYTLKDPNKPLIDNNAPQLSMVEPASNLPSPSVVTLTEPETPISTSTPVVSTDKTLPPATNPSPSVVAADKPAAALAMSSDVNKAAASVTMLPDDLANKRTELASDTVGKTTSNSNTNAAAPVKNNTPASAKTQVAIAPTEKLLSYPNTSLRQNLPDAPEIKAQKPVNEQATPDIQRNRQQEQRTQQLNRSLNQAYQAFQNRQWSQAQALYQTALQQDAYNRDALLGLASIALMQGNPPQAQQYYQTVLKHHPQDQTARLGILSATANAQPVNGERALRTLLNEDNVNKGYVYFSLGSLYASQHRWSAAQEAFFNAWRQDKQQPNYAYNLAVSLEHLNQPAAAIPYYQQALQLAQSNPSQSPNFNLQTVQQRLQILLTQLPSQQRELTQFLGQ